MAKKGSSGTQLDDFIVDQWGGLNTAIKSAKDLPLGVSPDSLNWITGWDPNQKKGDHIELRRGMALLGTNRNKGAGSVNGLGVGITISGIQIPFWSYRNNLFYYNASSQLNVSSGTLSSAAVNDYISIEAFQGLAGAFVYVSSPNSSMYKVPTANPTSLYDITSGSFQGHINFTNGRMNLWNKTQNPGQPDTLDRFQSSVDLATFSSAGFNQGIVAATGDGSTKSFPFTLSPLTLFGTIVIGAATEGATISGISAANEAIITTSTAHGLAVGSYLFVDGVASPYSSINQVVLTVLATTINTLTVNYDTHSFGSYISGGNLYPATEYFVDNQNGSLISNLGNVGTINYVTGAVTIAFSTAPINGEPVLVQTYNQAPEAGIEDFTIPASPGSGDPYLWPERDGGGSLNAIVPFSGSDYGLHSYRTWVNTNDSNTRGNSIDIPYRNNIGTPFYKSGYPTGDGIVYIDTTVPSDPKFQILTVAPNTTDQTVEPFHLSDSLDLSLQGFVAPPVIYWDKYYLFACQNIVNGSTQSFNGTTFIMNNESGYWDKLDYQISLFEKYYGMLLGGSSISNNVFTLFSGFDDDGSPINNYWTSGIYNLGFNGLKTTERFVIEGLIQPAQQLQIYASYDQGSFILIQTINGTDPCVSQGNPQLVGSDTVGSTAVGAGIVYANPFLLDFQLAADDYNYIQIKFVATKIGYVELDRWTLKLNQKKSMQVQPINTITP